MWETVLTQVLIGAGLVVVGAIAKIINKWVGVEEEKLEEQKKETAKKEALVAIQAGVEKVQRDAVEGIKAAAADGKLTKDEIKKVEQDAKNVALEVATGPAADYLLNLSTNAISGLINLVLGSKKKQPRP